MASQPLHVLPTALCTGQTGIERLPRSRVRQWTVRTEGWWYLMVSVCQTLSPMTRLQDRCAGQMQVRTRSPLTVS